MRALLLATLLALGARASRYDVRSAPKDGIYEEGVLHVHIVPHTHDDVGWLKTVDQYYYGANNTIQQAAVQYIIESVVTQLLRDEDRRFVYAEIAFFARWFTEQDEETQGLVRGLVEDGRLSFANGGWCMHDEASAHYVAMVDQTSLGHRFLREYLGFTPRVGWQLDPFGHSSTQASLLSWGAGFDALFFGRIDYQDRAIRQREKRCEGVWRASPSLGAGAQVFWGLTGSYGGNYGPPEGFDFDIRNKGVVPIMDDDRLPGYNVAERVDAFVAKALEQAAQTRGGHIMMTFGSDFNYEAAADYFMNLDKLIHYANADGRVRAFYSTPDAYVRAKAGEDIAWPVKTDDFFPYSDCEDCFWTGYFTSRPNLKRYERAMSAYQLAARQLELLSGAGAMAGDPVDAGPLSLLEEASAILQHHDAVSGTSKQHVAYDYALRLSAGQARAAPLVAGAMGALAEERLGLRGFGALQECPLSNVSVCSATGGDFLVTLYNPLGSRRAEVVSIPVPHAHYTVRDAATAQKMPCDVFPTAKSPAEDAQPFTLHVLVDAVGGLGARGLLVARDAAARGPVQARVPRAGEALEVSSDLVAAAFDESGFLKEVRVAADGGGGALRVPLRQDFGVYESFDAGLEGLDLGDCDPSTGAGCPPEYDDAALLRHAKLMAAKTPLELHRGVAAHRGDLSRKTQNSGAYIFRPKAPDADPAPVARRVALEVFEGTVVTEVRQTFADWLWQTVRVARGSAALELEWSVGDIPVGDGAGKEVVSRFSSGIRSGGALYTDSNGREFLRREYNARPSWDLEVFQPVAGNYYPVNAAAYLRDAGAQLSVLTDRTQGGASLGSGELELMLHRRILADDARGVGEPLNETQSITSYADPGCPACREGAGMASRGTHTLLLSPPARAMRDLRARMERVFSPLVAAYAPNFGPNSDAAGAVAAAQEAASVVPPNVKVLTAQALAEDRVLLRFAHLFAVDEDEQLSRPAAVNASAVLGALGYEVVGAQETSLTANQRREDLARVPWRTEHAGEARQPSPGGFDGDGVLVLQPMEIRTAVVRVKRRAA